MICDHVIMMITFSKMSLSSSLWPQKTRFFNCGDWWITGVNYNDDGTLKVTTTDKGILQVWQEQQQQQQQQQQQPVTVTVTVTVNTLNLTHNSFGHAYVDSLFLANFSPGDSKFIVSMSETAVIIYDTVSGTTVKQLDVCSEPSPAACAWSPDLRWLAVGCSDCCIRIYQCDDGWSLHHTIDEFYSGSISVAFSPDSKWLVSASVNDGVQIWTCPAHCDNACGNDNNGNNDDDHDHDDDDDDDDDELWSCLKYLTESLSAPLHCTHVSFSHDGSLLAVKYEANTISIWNCKTWQSFELQWPNHTLLTLKFIHQHNALAAVSSAGHVKMWDTNSWKCTLDTKLIQPTQHSELHAASFSPDGSEVSLAFDEQVYVFEVPSYQHHLMRLIFPSARRDLWPKPTQHTHCQSNSDEKEEHIDSQSGTAPGPAPAADCALISSFFDSSLFDVNVLRVIGAYL
jgi:WD40 repeat protein